MNLTEAFMHIAVAGGLDTNQLIEYAAEDTLGGRDTGDWPAMSTFESEGKIIYALVRALKPKQCVEIGVASGGTSTHILAALEANGAGKLFSVDIAEGVGYAVPEALNRRWTLIEKADGRTVKLPKHIDFAFEDGAHDYTFTYEMLMRLKGCDPRCILSHDYFTHLTYGDAFQVQRAFVDVFGVDQAVIVPPSIAGLGYWFNTAPVSDKDAK